MLVECIENIYFNWRNEIAYPLIKTVSLQNE